FPARHPRPFAAGRPRLVRRSLEGKPRLEVRFRNSILIPGRPGGVPVVQFPFGEETDTKFGAFVAVEFFRKVLRFPESLLRVQERRVGELEKSTSGAVFILDLAVETGFG